MRKSMAAVKQAGGAASLLAARKKLKKKKHLMRERKSADIKLVPSISSDSTDYEPSICQRVEITLRKSEDLHAVAYAIAIYFIAAFAGAILGGALTTVLLTAAVPAATLGLVAKRRSAKRRAQLEGVLFQIGKPTNVQASSSMTSTAADEVTSSYAAPTVWDEVPRFEPDDPALLIHLEEHGFAVVANALNAAEVETAKTMLWSFLTQAAGMKRDDPSTWGGSFFQVGTPATGIMHAKGVGHAEHSWYVRSRTRVIAAFAHIWGIDSSSSSSSSGGGGGGGGPENELLCSFDGGNVFRPWHHPFFEGSQVGKSTRTSLIPLSWKTRGGWFHLDQGRTKPDKMVCVQGVVTLFDANETTGGLTVIPGSHKHFKDVISDFATGDGDFVPLPPSVPILNLPKRLVRARAGDLLLWDSRTLHCNSPAVSPPTADPAELLRAVSYVCMTPKSWASEETLALRRQAFIDSVTTSHWPHEYTAASQRPPTGLAPKDPIAAGPVVRALVGFEKTRT